MFSFETSIDPLEFIAVITAIHAF